MSGIIGASDLVFIDGVVDTRVNLNFLKNNLNRGITNMKFGDNNLKRKLFLYNC